MELYKYKNYTQYKRVQEKTNIRKIDHVWAVEDNIIMLSDYLKSHVDTLEFGICHGTRNGKEQEWFRKYLGIEVIGTEISSTATQFPDTIQWDFHEIKKEWIDNVDFIYSNALDHSYKPVRCLDNWMSCVKQSGVCLLEWSSGHMHAARSDPFGATEEEYERLISKKYRLQDKLVIGGDKEVVCFVIAHL